MSGTVDSSAHWRRTVAIGAIEGDYVTPYRPIITLIALLVTPWASALEIDGAYVRGLPPTQKNTAAFFTVTNNGAAEICLRAGSSAAAERLEIHRHRHNNGMMSMQRQEELCVPPGARAEFAPGGTHLMLLNLQRPLRHGDKVELSLDVVGMGEQTFTAPVISVLKQADAPKTQSHHGHHGHGGDK